ncbi:hypothetical protein NMG60_11023249 [Bertholletia excelsa]
MRGIWAPMTLIYLGGPDTITVLALEENSMWVKHLIALLAQGARTAYVLYVTWTFSWYTYLALVLLFCGIIKYGERVWLMRSRAQWKHGDHVQYKETTGHPNDILSPERPNTALVLRAFSNFRNLNSLSQVDEFKEQYTKWLKGPDSARDIFKVIEIELGFMYNMLFTKVGTIFAVWGFVIRFINVSCLVFVLAVLIVFEKPPRFFYNIDFPISVVLLVGGIILEVAGVLMQLVSDRAVVWANQYHQIKLMKPIFCLQEHLLSKRKRWAGSMGQLDFVKFYSKPTYGSRGYLLSSFRESGSNINIVPGLKGLIIGHFRETYPAVKPELGFTTSRGKRTLDNVIIWHIVTEIFYHREDSKSIEMTMTKTLSNYIMYLLHTCSSSFSSSRTSGEFRGTISAIGKILEKEKGPISSTTDAQKQLLEKMLDLPNEPNLIKMLVQSLVKDEIRENKWDILSNVWVEILCHAASGWPAEQHAQNLRQGGEFLTHVWLLLVHLGEVKLLEVEVSVKLGDIAKAAGREMNIFKDLGTQDSSCFPGIV